MIEVTDDLEDEVTGPMPPPKAAALILLAAIAGFVAIWALGLYMCPLQPTAYECPGKSVDRVPTPAEVSVLK